MKIQTLVFASLVLAGCGTEPVYLRNMAGAMVQCGPYDNRAIQSIASADRERQCITDYQRQGYERAPK